MREVGDLDAAVVVDQRAPVEMAALQRIGVLVERGAVELGEAVRIVGGSGPAPSRAARRAPARWQASIEIDEVLRRAEAAGRREQAGRLVAP